MTGNGCKAWMLPLGQNRYAAIGEYEMVHIIPEWVRLQSIPQCPDYCNKVFMWQGQLIPVFDPHAWWHLQAVLAAAVTQETTPILCIVAYTDDNQTTGYGGMLLSGLPFRTNVLNDQFCDFPEDNDRWGAIAVSCFSDPGSGPSPVLDLKRIFTTTPQNGIQGQR